MNVINFQKRTTVKDDKVNPNNASLAEIKELKVRAENVQAKLDLYTRNGIEISPELHQEAIESTFAYASAVMNSFTVEEMDMLRQRAINTELAYKKRFQWYFDNMPDLPAAQIIYKYNILKKYVEEYQNVSSYKEREDIFDSFCYIYCNVLDGELYYAKKCGHKIICEVEPLSFDIMAEDMSNNRACEETLNMINKILNTLMLAGHEQELCTYLSTFYLVARMLDVEDHESEYTE